MKKTLILSLLVAASTCITAQADTIKIVGTTFSSDGGGEFTVLPTGLNNSGYSSLTKNIGQNGTFQTFCVEQGSPIKAGVTYDATQGLITTTGIPLNRGTAWLYENFAKGTLTGYDYPDNGVGRLTSAADLQQEIWHLMQGPVTALNPFFHALVVANVTDWMNPSTPDFSPVVVLNLKLDLVGTADQDIQDVLYIPGNSVPDGGLTLALLGMGLTGIGVISRRARK